MPSRHGTLAQKLIDHLNNNWPEKPENTSIIRSHDYVHLVKELTDEQQAIIAVIVPRISATIGDRGSDTDDIPVFVCVVANLDDIETATVDVWDEHAESCRDSLRKRSLSKLDLGNGNEARRRGTVNLTTTYDADFLDANEVFFAVMAMKYLIDVDVK